MRSLNLLNDTFGSTGFFCIDFFQTFLKFGRKLVKTSLTTWFKVNIIKLGLLIHFRVAKRTGKMIHTPGFVQCCKYISRDDLVTNKAQVSKQLMIMSFAVSLTFFLVMSVPQEWFLALRTNKMFHMPIFPERSDNSFLDWFMTGTANWNTHLVMTSKAIEFTLQLPGFGIEFDSTSIAVEMIRMVWLPLKRTLSEIKFQISDCYLVFQRSTFINNCMTLETNVFTNGSSFFSCIAFVAQRSSGIFDKSLVSERNLAGFTPKAKWVPVVIQCFDHSSCLWGNKL